MITRLKLKPGQRGTKKLLAEHGNALVCVRYRYDKARRVKMKTIELIIESSPWNPPVSRLADDDLVALRISYDDTASRDAAKTARGRWDPEKKLWIVKYGKVRGTILEKHIVLDAFPDN